MDIIPSIYDQRQIGSSPFLDVFQNLKLHQGEVRELIPPTSDRSISKIFNEYDVLVGFYEGGIVGHKVYRNCILINPLAGGADRSKWTLRPSTKPVEELGSGDGSRVLVLCIEGSNNQAVILGGLEDGRCGGDDPNLKHHLEWEFNGINLKINDDGSFIVTNKGKTTNLGEIDKSANKDGIGTKVEVQANGNFVVTSAKGSQRLIIDNVNDTVVIEGSKSVTVDGDKICLGADADKSTVVGPELVSILRDLISAITKMTAFTFGTPPGPLTGPPLNAPEFVAIARRLDGILSKQTFVKK